MYLSTNTKLIIVHMYIKGNIMTTILVVVTFLAGTAWGPTVTMAPTSGAEACGALRWEVARQIANAARTNVTGAPACRKTGKS